MFLPPQYRLLVSRAVYSSLAFVMLFVIAGCKTAQADPTFAAVVDASDPAAAELGAQLQTLAGTVAGPVGFMAAGLFLPIIWAFVKNTLKGTASAAGTAVTDAAKTVGLPVTEAPKA